MGFLKTSLSAAALCLLLASCSGRGDSAYVQNTFVMSTPASVEIYGADEADGKKLADAILDEWKRISSEYAVTEPFGFTAYVNKNAYHEPVEVEDEFLSLLEQGMAYYRMTGGAFDITFAPLWPIWKEAAASKTMPSKETIAHALADMGSAYVQADPVRKTVRFTRPVQINMGGYLRSYALLRGREIVKKMYGGRFPVRLKIGGSILAYGKKDWSYGVPDPFHDGKTLGRLHFGEGLLLASSGREHFVEIEGKLYSHILDLKTGYPLPDFSNLLVYFPYTEKEEYVPSAVLAVMGKKKAFDLISRTPGAAGLWIDGKGAPELCLGSGSPVKWERRESLLRKLTSAMKR